MGSLRGRADSRCVTTSAAAEIVYNLNMTDVVNLKRARKNKARDDRRAKADENAVRFGRTKAQKDRESAEAERTRRDLDGHEREK